MADNEISVLLQDGAAAVAASVVNGSGSSSSAADVVEFDAQLDDAVQVLSHRGQTTLAALAVGLVELGLQTAMWLLDDEVRGGLLVDGDPALLDEFCRSIRGNLLSLQETAGNNDDEHGGVSDQAAAFPLMVFEAVHQHAARLVLGHDDDETAIQLQPDRNGGAVPASAAAVRSLEKQTFLHAAGGSDDDDGGGGGGGVTECSICLKEFADGEQVSLMPCPSSQGGHKFHPDCIAKWLGISNMCPLCRYQLPACC